MSDMQQPESNRSPLRDALERVLAAQEPEWILARAIAHENNQFFLLRQKLGGETISLDLNVLRSVAEAVEQFGRSGNQFIAPKLSLSPSVQFDPPTKAEAEISGLAEENHLWRGYGRNRRGVIKLREGSVIAQVNASSVEEAERFAWHVVDLLRTA